MVNKISESEYRKVKEAPVALIDFSANWCGPCKMIAPVLEDVSEELKDKVSFFNIDVDENPGLAQEFGVESIPTLVLLKHGEKVDSQVGFMPKEYIADFIKAHI